MTNYPADLQNAINAFNNANSNSLKLIQITDTHLYRDTDKKLAGVNTEESLHSVIQLAAKLPNADGLLLTGDLVHDSSKEAYERFYQHIQQLNASGYCIPGNHDETEKLNQFTARCSLQSLGTFETDHWLFIMLDSSIEGEAGSRFTDNELHRLRLTLESADNNKHVALCMHHQPVPIASKWMDTMALSNQHAFFSLLSAYPQVKTIIFGHIHQEFYAEYQAIKLFGTPSTCIQFSPESDEFGLDIIPPGFRWLVMSDTGEIQSGIVRATELPEGLKTDIWGYS